MGKKLRKIDRDMDISWKKLGIGYNEDRRDIWVEIHDELEICIQISSNEEASSGDCKSVT